MNNLSLQALEMAQYVPANPAERDTAGAPLCTQPLVVIASLCSRLDWRSARCAGVSIGVGMSGVASVAQAGANVLAGNLRRVSPFFVPTVLNNMAAGPPLCCESNSRMICLPDDNTNNHAHTQGR